MFLTFSFAGVLSGALLSVAVILKKYDRFLIRSGFLLGVCVLLIPLYYLAAERTLNTSISPIVLRANLISEVFNQEPIEIILGNGPLGVPTELARFTGDEVMVDNGLAAFPDAGAWLFLIMKFGLVSLLILHLLCLKNAFKLEPTCLFLRLFY